MIRRPPRSTLSSSSAASDVYKRQAPNHSTSTDPCTACVPERLSIDRQDGRHMIIYCPLFVGSRCARPQRMRLRCSIWRSAPRYRSCFSHPARRALRSGVALSMALPLSFLHVSISMLHSLSLAEMHASTSLWALGCASGFSLLDRHSTALQSMLLVRVALLGPRCWSSCFYQVPRHRYHSVVLCSCCLLFNVSLSQAREYICIVTTRD